MVLHTRLRSCSRHFKRTRRSLSTARNKPSSFSSTASTVATATTDTPNSDNHGSIESQPAVSTYRWQRIPTDSHFRRIPLSIADMHLRHEQLPFCYFFDETLDEEELISSLQVVLRHFPQMGGSICDISHTAIKCQPDDTVHIAFGRMNTSLEEWQRQPRGHIHQSCCTTGASKSMHDANRGNGHPILLPLFDSLFEDEETTTPHTNRRALVKIRVTYFQDVKGSARGTAIAVNTCHALGDTATCFNFVQSWGKQMRRKEYQKDHCTDRSKACVSGMMTSEVADVMGLSLPDANSEGGKHCTGSLLDLLQTWLFEEQEVASEVVRNTTHSSAETAVSSAATDSVEMLSSARIPHQYLRLHFPIPLLHRLKDMGSSSCRNGENPSSFLSTNDMLTSYGWLLKRYLSRKDDHSLSMVLNLRGRSGVNPNLFGNGISHVVANTLSCIQDKERNHEAKSTSLRFTNKLCLAAKAVREALQLGLSDLPQALVSSQMGRALSPPANSTQSFSTTSWGQFPLYQIQFAEHSLCGFHGHPAHPLPEGRTFASVITPSPDGGFWYEMLLPTDQAQQARDKHLEMTTMCMSWEEPCDMATPNASSETAKPYKYYTRPCDV